MIFVSEMTRLTLLISVYIFRLLKGDSVSIILDTEGKERLLSIRICIEQHDFDLSFGLEELDGKHRGISL